MKIKRYLVENMPEAYEKIKKDLGKNAVIISSRKVRERGIKGLFGAKRIEVTAALESNSLPKQEEELAASESNSRFEKELSDLKLMVKKMLNSSQQESTPMGYWKVSLEKLDINQQLIEELLYDIGDNPETEWGNDKLVREALVTRLSKNFIQPSEDDFNSDGRRIYAFVGPTGVGKTTTLAKLAARYVFTLNKKVGLITIDTYRIGAVDQLKKYGDILNVDLEVVMTPEELKEAVDKYRDMEVVLIDTAGRPSTDSMKLNELKKFLNVINPVDIYLVMSCTTKNSDLERIIVDYNILQYTHIIFTKMDETDTLGSIANVAYLTEKPIAYLTNGQDVPDDILTVEPNKLAELILNNGEVR